MAGTGRKKKTQAELRAEKSDCWCGNPDPDKCVQCDNNEGCFRWYHWECEGFTEEQIEDIDEYTCTGCLDKGNGKITYKAGNPNDDVVQNNGQDDDDDVIEYVPEDEDESDSHCSGSEFDSESDTEKEYSGTEIESDSGDSSDDAAVDPSADYDEAVTTGQKRKAASQPAPQCKAQKTSKQPVSGSRKPLASGRVAASRPVRRRFQLTD